MMGFCSRDEIIRNIHETLKLSRDGTFNDVTLICRDGQSQSNSIFLATVFPVMRNIFQRSNIINEDLVVIFLPDVSTRDIEDLFQSIYQLKESFPVSKDILDLLYFSDEVKCDDDETNQKLTNGDCESVNEVDNNTKKKRKYRKRISNTHAVMDYTHAKSENEDAVNDIKSDPDDVDNFIQMIDPIENDNLENENNVNYGEDSNMVKKKFDEIKIRKTQSSAGDLECRGDCGDSSCDKIFKKSSSKWRHVGDKLNGPRSCHICGVTYSNKSSMDKHLQEHEGGWMGKTRCPMCHKVIPSKKIDEHMKVCEPKPKVKEAIKVVCNLCGLSVGKHYLKEHIMYQHEVQEKRFLCDKCDLSFVGKHKLKQHMRSKHTEKLPCPHCGVKVRRLDIHISAKHTPDHEQKYQCQDCGKGFGELRILKAHQMNVHLKLRPYNCRYGCAIAYNDISNRNQHEKRQHGKLFVKYDSKGREIEDKNS